MDPERYRRVGELFDQVSKRPEGERRRFLREACGEDDELRREVDSLLSADREMGSFIEEPARLEPDADTEAEAPASLGPYRILRQLGEGGMGTVYLAARADEEYRKRVAIKVIRQDGRGDLLSRFRTERQILAGLEHPGIARMLDGGTTEEGLPYLVMDYVQGEPIDRFCQGHELSVEARLRLFGEVCAAVHYAHRNLVVHRDIKPANVLVRPDGAPVLLDFGIAKLLDPEAFPATVQQTRASERLLTPHYASPEQVRGEAITTASDVYSLGVLLYKLLTGQLPYDLEGLSPGEVERAICERDPDKPSTAVRSADASPGASDGTGPPARARRRLAGDLDNILLKALAKNPEARYGSVQAFAEDLGRHLRGLPVNARPPTLRYRTGKFLRRHKLAATMTLMLGLWTLGFAIAMAMQARTVAKERDQARQERDKAGEVSEFLREIFQLADPGEARGESITALEILDRGAERARALSAQPELHATLLAVIGEVYMNLGLYARAEPVLEETLEIRRRVPEIESRELVESLNDLGVLRFYRGEGEAAKALLGEALEIHRRLADEPGDTESGVNHAATLNNLAALHRSRGEYAAAEALYREAVRLQIRLHGEEHPEVATMLSNVAVVAQDQGDFETADELYREVLKRRSETLGEDHPDSLMSLDNLATLLYRRGFEEEAEEMFRRALEGRLEVLGEEHPSTAWSMHNLATVLSRRGEHAAAESLYRTVLEVRRKTVGEKHKDYAYALHSLAGALRDKGDHVAAEASFQEALELGQGSLGEEHPLYSNILAGYGLLLLETERPKAAEPLFRQALEIRRAGLGKEHWITAEAMDGLGRCLLALGRLAEAEPLLSRSLSLFLAGPNPRGQQIPRVLRSLLELYQEQGADTQSAEIRRRLREWELAEQALPGGRVPVTSPAPDDSANP